MHMKSWYETVFPGQAVVLIMTFNTMVLLVLTSSSQSCQDSDYSAVLV